MKYITTKQAESKWNISERRIRQLIKDNRIEGCIKIGKTWNIPENTPKPIDKRKNIHDDFIMNINEEQIKNIEKLKSIIDNNILKNTSLFSIKESLYLEWIYNSNAIEGNSLTLRETQIVLEEGITIGGKPVKDHIEAINHEKALEYLDYLIDNKEQITEWNIKLLHDLILKGLNEEAGKYRSSNVLIKGAKHIPPDHIRIPELMNLLIEKYHHWQKYHPIIQAALFSGELVKIHPFIDGNGRTSRLLLNMILMINGYCPIIIEVTDRLKYYEALDKAHTTNDYTDYINMLINIEENTLKSYIKLF